VLSVLLCVVQASAVQTDSHRRFGQPIFKGKAVKEG